MQRHSQIGITHGPCSILEHTWYGLCRMSWCLQRTGMVSQDNVACQRLALHHAAVRCRLCCRCYNTLLKGHATRDAQMFIPSTQQVEMVTVEHYELSLNQAAIPAMLDTAVQSNLCCQVAATILSDKAGSG